MNKVATVVALLVLATMLNPVAASSSLGSSNYHHPYPTGIVPGDIVIGHNSLSSIISQGTGPTLV